MYWSLRAQILSSLCAVAVLSTGLVLMLEQRSLSGDLEARAADRFVASAVGVDRLLDHRLALLRGSYEAVAARPQVRAVVELGDAPTLSHLAGTLRRAQNATRLVFLSREGQVVAGDGDERFDALVDLDSDARLVALEGRAYMAVSVPIRAGTLRLGALVSVEPLPADELESWSAIAGARVVFDSQSEPDPNLVRQVVVDLGDWKLFVEAPRLRPEDHAALSKARSRLFAAGLIALVVAFLGGLALSRRLTRPIQELGRAAERINVGDFDVRINTARSDEIGIVARTFARMTANLKTAITAVMGSADAVEATADQISSLTATVAHATVQMARETSDVSATISRISEEVVAIADASGVSAQVLRDSVQGSSAAAEGLLELGNALSKNADILCAQADEVASTMSEMAATSAQIAENALSVSENSEVSATAVEEVVRATAKVDEYAEKSGLLSAQVVEIADRGREKVQSTIEGMDSIHHATEEAKAAISTLGDRVGEISGVVSLIESITDEVNLLALNASIVAAQAGERGRAFGVVAGQIKALAKRVFAETSKIEGIVGAVEHESGNALAAIDSSVGRVDAGVALAAEAGAALTDITETARENRQHMDDVLDATRIQSHASAHALTQIENTNSSMAEIRAACAEQARTAGVLSRSAGVLVEAAREVFEASQQQTSESENIVRAVEVVHAEVEQNSRSLREQAAAFSEAYVSLESANQRAGANQASVTQVEEAVRALLTQAQHLRREIKRFHA